MLEFPDFPLSVWCILFIDWHCAIKWQTSKSLLKSNKTKNFFIQNLLKYITVQHAEVHFQIYPLHFLMYSIYWLALCDQLTNKQVFSYIRQDFKNFILSRLDFFKRISVLRVSVHFQIPHYFLIHSIYCWALRHQMAKKEQILDKSDMIRKIFTPNGLQLLKMYHCTACWSTFPSFPFPILTHSICWLALHRCQTKKSLLK